ncbi:hypothetical protein SH661x_002187 [Planctomicrobium sp. SH661]|uniref:hypothetical protein n=1 Tax=Planctomicrobium sp. SH661 TaxID=3448124 RepID=UPI003F5C5173
MSCDPCGSSMACGPTMPWDTPYCGCVETNAFGKPQSACAQRRQMRRAMKGSCGVAGCTGCNTCNSEFAGMDYGNPGFNSVLPGMQSGMMMQGSSCPTCQQNQMQMQMGAPSMGQPMMVQPGMEHYHSDPTHMNHSPMSVPTPMPSEPTLSIPTPNPTPSPAPAPNSTTYYQPYQQPYQPQMGQYYSPPPQIQPFNTYSPAPVQQTLYAP